MDLNTFHTALSGTPPTEIQATLYREHLAQDFRGFAYPELDPQRFAATAILALWLTRSHGRVNVLVPPVALQWAIENLRTAVRDFVRYHRSHPKILNSIREAVQKLSLGSRVLQLQNEPECWVAFGFSSDTPVPNWLHAKLLAEMPYDG